jgi:AraC family transcriptional regulator
MLRHFTNGCVSWKDPIPCQKRTNWEFYAVLDGRCSLRFSESEPWVPHSRSLWVFAPECSHGWANTDGSSFYRVALHFNTVPDPLGELARTRGGWLRRSLSEAEVAQLRALADGVAPHFHAPTRVSSIHIERCLLELSLLVLEGIEAAEAPPALTDLAALRIERALAWYAVHLARRPTVKQVADAVHVSPSHLRRLFIQSRGASPKTLFERIRLERAMELMGNSMLTLEDVAVRCGYTGASHLCREHMALLHFTPTTWRKRLVDRFLDVVPPSVRAQDCNVRPRKVALAS